MTRKAKRAGIPRLWNGAKRVLVVADLHCGHNAGLTHPDYDTSCIESDDPTRFHKSRRLRQAAQRRKLWNWFSTEVNKYRPFDVILVNGDAVEGKGFRSGGTELLTTDRDEQVEIAAAAIEHISEKNTSVYMTYGTPYHTGGDEDWEDVLFREIKAERIEGEGHYDVNGLQIAMKHKIGTSRSPASRYTMLGNAAIRQQLWAARGQQPRANLIIRSHTHTCLMIAEPGTNVTVITTPALEGLGSKYGIRQVDGLPVEFGFLVLDVLDAQRNACTPVIAPLELQKCGVTKL